MKIGVYPCVDRLAVAYQNGCGLYRRNAIRYKSNFGKGIRASLHILQLNKTLQGGNKRSSIRYFQSLEMHKSLENIEERLATALQLELLGTMEVNLFERGEILNQGWLLFKAGYSELVLSRASIDLTP